MHSTGHSSNSTSSQAHSKLLTSVKRCYSDLASERLAAAGQERAAGRRVPAEVLHAAQEVPRGGALPAVVGALERLMLADGFSKPAHQLVPGEKVLLHDGRAARIDGVDFFWAHPADVVCVETYTDKSEAVQRCSLFNARVTVTRSALLLMGRNSRRVRRVFFSAEALLPPDGHPLAAIAAGARAQRARLRPRALIRPQGHLAASPCTLRERPAPVGAPPPPPRPRGARPPAGALGPPTSAAVSRTPVEVLNSRASDYVASNDMRPSTPLPTCPSSQQLRRPHCTTSASLKMCAAPGHATARARRAKSQQRSAATVDLRWATSLALLLCGRDEVTP